MVECEEAMNTSQPLKIAGHRAYKKPARSSSPVSCGKDFQSRSIRPHRGHIQFERTPVDERSLRIGTRQLEHHIPAELGERLDSMYAPHFVQ